jgi:hypothetical protein
MVESGTSPRRAGSLGLSNEETPMRSKPIGMAAVLAACCVLAACDKSPQAADGTTQTGDPGSAAATSTGAVADTGRDTQASGADIGGAGQVAEPGGATSAGGATSPKNQ